MKVGFRYSVVTAHVSLNLVPEIVDAVDMTFRFDKCLRMIDPEVVTRRAAKQNITIQHIQPGKPQQNAYIERYNRTVRHE